MINKSRPLRLLCDGSTDDLGVTLKQKQPDGSIFLIVYIRRATPPFLFIFRYVSHPLSLPLSSCLRCIPPLIGLPLLRSLLTSVLCGCLLSVSSVCDFVCVFCFLLIATMSFADYFLIRYFCPLFLLISERIPGLIWFGSVYLVTTAGFVADQ